MASVRRFIYVKMRVERGGCDQFLPAVESDFSFASWRFAVIGMGAQPRVDNYDWSDDRGLVRWSTASSESEPPRGLRVRQS